MKIKFEDIDTFDERSTYYIAPNEDPLVIRELVKNVHVRRVGGICSGGEVGFFGLLPSAREELVLVDHSYKSLGIAMLKFLLLAEQGWQETHRLLSTDAATSELATVLDRLKKDLPQPFETVAVPPFVLNTGYYDPGFPGELPRKRLHVELKEMWRTVPMSLLQTAYAKLDQVSFVHGDITDLEKRGPFDLVYISNATGHGNRFRKVLEMADFVNAIKPDGYILRSVGYTPVAELQSVKVVEEKNPPGQWTYQLCQFTTVKEEGSGHASA